MSALNSLSRPLNPMGHFVHHFVWKDPLDRAKGVNWAYLHEDFVKRYGIKTAAYTRDRPAPADDQKCFTASRNSRTKGAKWIFTMEDGSKFSCRTSCATSYSAIKAWAMTWDLKPVHIERGIKGSTKATSLRNHHINDQHKVYFVKLLTFEATKLGKFYYKIGKSKNVPQRIRQFGPCEIIEVLHFEHYSEAFEAESRLHRLFSHLRKESTEIFLLSDDEAEAIRNSISAIENNEGDPGAYAKREQMRWG